MGGIGGHTSSVNRPTPLITHYGRRERDHDAPLFAKRRWLAVSSIGFPQNISVGPNALDLEDFRDWSVPIPIEKNSGLPKGLPGIFAAVYPRKVAAYIFPR